MEFEFTEELEFSGVRIEITDTNGLAREISAGQYDKYGFIEAPGATITYYKWDPLSESTPLTYDELTKSGGITGIGDYRMIAGTAADSIQARFGPPSTAAIKESLGPGGVGIFKEDVEDTTGGLYGEGWMGTLKDQNGNAARLKLYSAVDSDGISLKINRYTPGPGWQSNQLHMRMDVEYSDAEINALDEKYGYLSSGDSGLNHMNNRLSDMALDLLQTFTNNRLTQSKAHKKARLTYKDIVSLTNIEPASNVSISTTASTEIIEASDTSDGFTYSSTVASDY